MYAPVIIYTLCRYKHFRRCVESLANCTHANETELFIGLDYPAKDSHKQGYKQLKDYLHGEDFQELSKSFKNVVLQERQYNYGPTKNFEELRAACYGSGYDRYIVSEDDNEFSPNFLDYIDKGLDKYKDYPSVYAICGYTPVIDAEAYNKNVYATYEYSAWGMGLWKSKVYKYNRQEIIQILKQPALCWKLFKKEPRILYTLYRMMNKRTHLYGDTCAVTRSILNNLYSIFPTVSKVRNWGNDGSGVNCYKIDDRKYTEQEIDTNPTFDFDDIEIKETKLKALRKHASLSWKQWVKFPYQICKFWIMTIKLKKS